jgi:EAL domain-containing protein (putative c-di-GMP-specific phosphodiesterase class I)
LAMARAKQRGHGHTELFDEVLRTTAHRRLTVSAALDGALERREFTVHYQPVVDLSTGMMVSVEALLRWNHPERGLISPVEVIPLAEETGLIVTIGAWLLEEACKALIEWQAIQDANHADEPFTVAVNMSVRQMQAPDIAGMVVGVLKRTGIRPADLCLELTESVFMDDVDYFDRTLRSLKALGLNLAIDDFGTGFSSLSYLKRFPIDAVKIDKSFVDGLGINPHDTALVAAIVAMAAALDLDLTVEGVETALQVAELKKLHVRRVQGYLLARSMPADDISQLLARSHRWTID